MNHTYELDRFRWVICQLDDLRKCVNHAQVRKTLDDLPRSLDETYDRILCSIKERHCQSTYSILKWLAFSARPLHTTEVADIPGINLQGKAGFDHEDILEDPLDVLRLCRSLITIDNVPIIELGNVTGHHSDVRLAHYSVKEYLLSERICTGPAAIYRLQESQCQAHLANSCLVYLSQLTIPPDSTYSNLWETFRLAGYAAQFWIKHLQAADTNDNMVQDLIFNFFWRKRGAYEVWHWMYDMDQGCWRHSRPSQIPTPLYHACRAGLTPTVRRLLKQTDVEVNARTGSYGNALRATLASGDKSLDRQRDIISMIFDAGAAYDSKAFATASKFNQVEVMKLLFSEAAKRGHVYRLGHALCIAASNGSVKAVELLIEKGANVNFPSRLHGCPLQAACTIKKSAVWSWCQTPSRKPVRGNSWYSANIEYRKTKLEVVQLLLQGGADPSVQGDQVRQLVASGSARPTRRDGRDTYKLGR